MNWSEPNWIQVKGSRAWARHLLRYSLVGTPGVESYLG